MADKREDGEGGMDWEFRMSRYKLLYREWIKNKSLYSTRNYIQYPMITIMEKNMRKEHIYTHICIYTYIYIYMCITEALGYTAESNTKF